MTNSPSSAYSQLGVDAQKIDVHAAVSASGIGQSNLYPGAFCTILEDIFGNDPKMCVLKHDDGVGSKILVAYLHYKLTGDASWFKRPTRDCTAMNIDDMACVGAVDNFLASNTVDRNRQHIGADVLTALMQGYREIAEWMKECGINLINCGGETADLPNNVRTITANASMTTRFPRADVIDCARIVPGDVIIGLSSAGKARGEDLENSGIGSNGLTLGQHALLQHQYYDRFPETVDPLTDEKLLYRGPFAVESQPDELNGMSVGEALSSPTRIFLPTIKQILELHRADVHGLFHNTGGGLTKAMGFGKEITYNKDKLPPAPAIFKLIAQHGEVPNRDMLETFNNGILMEIIAQEQISDSIIQIAEQAGIQAWKIGHCETSSTGKNCVVVNSPDFGTHTYHPKH